MKNPKPTDPRYIVDIDLIFGAFRKTLYSNSTPIEEKRLLKRTARHLSEIANGRREFWMVFCMHQFTRPREAFIYMLGLIDFLKNNGYLVARIISTPKMKKMPEKKEILRNDMGNLFQILFKKI